jgi:Rieske Fe-S protein
MTIPAMPSDSHCDGCAIGRRAFVSQATLVAAAALLAEACGTGVWEPVAPNGSTPTPPSGGLTLTVSAYPALATVGGIANVSSAAGMPLAIARTAADRFVAIALRCTHQGTTVNISGSGFLCPNHGARYAMDGTWIGGQPTTSLKTFPVTFTAATGTLFIPGAAGAAGS